MNQIKTNKIKIRLVYGYGRSSSTEIVEAQCQEQRGKFYVGVQTLNASSIGVGSSPTEAVADYANKCGATSHRQIEKQTEAAEGPGQAPLKHERPRG